MGLVFQQPEDQIFEQYVGDEVAFAARNFGVQGKLSDIVRDAMGAVGLDFENFKDRFTSMLSGGEQRKVALASVLAGHPEVLLLDEPLAGLDPQSRQEVTGHLKSLTQKGITLLLSTHQFNDVAEMLDVVSVLAGGTDIMNGETWSVFCQVEKLEKAGIKPPLAVRAANAFRQKGWPIAKNSVSNDQLIRNVVDILNGSANE